MKQNFLGIHSGRERTQAWGINPDLFPIISAFAGKSGAVLKILAISRYLDSTVAAVLSQRKPMCRY